MLIADQFEELYTLCRDPAEQKAFLDCLLSVFSSPLPILKLALTLRADFFGQALSYRPLADALQVAQQNLGPMNRAELVAMVEEPARRRGIALEEGLTERILAAVTERPGHLPLLEFALTLLWDRQKERKLTHAAYEELGGVERTLANYAEEVYSELNRQEQKRAQGLFAQLVRPGEGTEDTRRVATRHELGEENWRLVAELATRRLVVTGRDSANGQETVEVVHEALIQGWQRLKDWMEADREFRLWQEQLRLTLRQWQLNGQDEEILLRGKWLLEAEDWALKRSQDLSEAEQAFIQASVAHREQERTRHNRLRRILILGLITGLALTLLLAALATFQGVQATEQRNAALNSQATAQATAQERATAQALTALRQRQTLARQLAEQARNNLNGQLDLALLLSLEANCLSDGSSEARSSLFAGLTYNPRLVTFLHNQGQAVNNMALSRDGKILAVGGNDGLIQLWNILTRQSFGPPLDTTGGAVYSLAFSPDGAMLASGGRDGAIRVWNPPPS